ncbi:MAG: thioredoxin fold domain-containing protein [Thiomonas sp.]
MTLTRRRFTFALLIAAAWRGAHAAATAQRPDVRAAVQVLAHLPQATAIAEGRGTRVLTVFFDPNCPSCRQLYRDLRPSVGEDGLQIDWVPVAILAPSSLGKAAAILQSADRLQAFREMEDHALDPNLPAPAVPTASQIRATTRQTLRANEAVLKQAGAYYSVPLAVYRNRAGQPELLLGAPRDDKVLAALLYTVGP